MVRSDNPKTIFKDIERAFERTINDVFDEINTIAKTKTPVRTGFAQRQWRTVGQYKLGDTKTVIDNKATYIGLLDGELGTPTSKQAPKGIVVPTLKKVLNRRRTIR